MKIKKDMLIGDVINKYPELAEIMFDFGLHCIGCRVSGFETIEQGCQAHGLNEKKIEEMITKMNKKIDTSKDSLKISKEATEELLTKLKGKGLRISEKIEIVENPEKDDKVLKDNDIKIFIAKNKIKDVKGKRLHFKNEKFILE